MNICGQRNKYPFVAGVIVASYISLWCGLSVFRSPAGEMFFPPGQWQSARRQFDASGEDPRVAIGVAVTSVGMGNISADDPYKDVQLFHVLLSSFCRTASRGFVYHFYVAYDNTDQFFVSNTEGLQRHYREQIDRECAGIRVQRSIHLHQCGYTARPAWSQNDAMMEAYLDGNDYFYRVNDDSRMESSGWTEAFVDALRRRDPPNVGVVGPHHSGGNTNILTHDFVHKTHIEIFGLYYPRCYSDLYADTWISKVYRCDHVSKLPNVLLTHTQGMGKRYQTRGEPLCSKMDMVIGDDEAIFQRYLNYKKVASPPDGKKVIAISLSGDHARHTVGAIRNAQLVPVMFPGWRLRVYTPAGPGGKATPQRIVDRLAELGAEINLVNSTAASMPPALWPYLIVDDASAERFIVRKAAGRLSRRDFSAVSDWIANGTCLHILRDQKKRQKYAKVADELWGGTAALKGFLPSTMKDILYSYLDISDSERDILERIRNSVKADYLIHDGTSCKHDLLHCRLLTTYAKYRVGQLFNEVHRSLLVHESK